MFYRDWHIESMNYLQNNKIGVQSIKKNTKRYYQQHWTKYRVSWKIKANSPKIQTLGSEEEVNRPLTEKRSSGYTIIRESAAPGSNPRQIEWKTL